ncbi:MAG: VanZ family protein [Chitinophagaceae bacterium]
MKNLFAKLYIPIAWTIFIQVLLCLPGNAIPGSVGFEIPDFDKVIHIIFFGTLVGLWCFYFSTRGYSPNKMRIAFFCVFLLSATNGIVIEFIQFHFIPGRNFDDGDIIADVLSSGIGYGICNVKLLT